MASVRSASDTLAPSYNGNSLKKPAGKRLVKPQPAGARPQRTKWTYPVWNLMYVPKRLIMPPKPDGGFASVRSFSSTPLSNIRLEDVMANKFLAPLSLRDFEGYLVFREMSAENLYFILWLIQYEKEYAAWRADKGGLRQVDPSLSGFSQLPEHLTLSLQRGLEVFLTPDGPLELNLESNLRAKTLRKVGDSGDPVDLAEAKEVVMNSLGRSLAMYTRGCVANAGPRRLVFCFCLGLTVFLGGLIPPFAGIFMDKARGIRAIGLPFICLGVAIMTMALKRICAVIWLLGEDRQLLPWELRAPSVTSGSIVPMSSASSIRSDGSSTFGSEAGDSLHSANSSNPFPWESEKDDDWAASEFTVQMSAPNSPSIPPSYQSKQRLSVSSIPSSAPVWGPLTLVHSPEVARAQWGIAVFGLLTGVVFCVLLGAPLMAVPNMAR